MADRLEVKTNQSGRGRECDRLEGQLSGWTEWCSLVSDLLQLASSRRRACPVVQSQYSSSWQSRESGCCCSGPCTLSRHSSCRRGKPRSPLRSIFYEQLHPLSKKSGAVLLALQHSPLIDSPPRVPPAAMNEDTSPAPLWVHILATSISLIVFYYAMLFLIKSIRESPALAALWRGLQWCYRRAQRALRGEATRGEFFKDCLSRRTSQMADRLFRPFSRISG